MSKEALLSKTYDGGSAVDMERDIAEVMSACRKQEGEFRLRLVWCSPDDCDCTGFQHRYDCPHHTMCD